MRHVFHALLAVALALLAGCVDYDEQLTLDKDGSGRIRMRMALDEETYESMLEMAEKLEGEEAPMASLSKEQIEEALKTRKSRAKLEKYSQKIEGSDKVWEMEFSFKNLDDLADVGVAIDEEDTEEQEGLVFLYEKQADGTWLYKRLVEPESMEGGSRAAAGQDEAAGMPPGMPPGMPESFDPENFDPEEMAAQMEEFAKEVQEMGERFEKDKARMEADAAKRRIHFSVTFPGKIIESNATRVEGKTAIWEYKLSEMQKLEGRLPELTARVRH